MIDCMSKAERKVLVLALSRRDFGYGIWTEDSYTFSNDADQSVIRAELRAMQIEYAHAGDHSMAEACGDMRDRIPV